MNLVDLDRGVSLLTITYSVTLTSTSMAGDMPGSGAFKSVMIGLTTPKAILYMFPCMGEKGWNLALVKRYLGITIVWFWFSEDSGFNIYIFDEFVAASVG